MGETYVLFHSLILRIEAEKKEALEKKRDKFNRAVEKESKHIDNLEDLLAIIKKCDARLQVTLRRDAYSSIQQLEEPIVDGKKEEPLTLDFMLKIMTYFQEKYKREWVEFGLDGLIQHFVTTLVCFSFGFAIVALNCLGKYRVEDLGTFS